MRASVACGALLIAASLAISGCAAQGQLQEEAQGLQQGQAQGREVKTPQPIVSMASSVNEDVIEGDQVPSDQITEASTVEEIESLPEFEGFGRLLFPVDRPVSGDDTLSDLASNGTFAWYSNLRADAFAGELERWRQDAGSGGCIFYPIYTDAEMVADPRLEDTGLFFFRGKPGAPFAIVNAGGGFAYVAALHDSFPVAQALSQKGYNAFALIYRTDRPYEDLARAIEFVHDNASELGVDANGYSLWGGSAGARMAAALGNRSALDQLTGRDDIPQASMVVTQYTGLSSAYSDDAPTYACVGTNDGIANWQTMRRRLDALSQMGIPTEFHEYQGLSHGFGLGTGTVAEGWIDDAVRFWDANRK